MKIAFLIPAIDAMGPNIFIQNLIASLSPFHDVECEVFHFDRGSKDIRQLIFPVKVTKLDFDRKYDFTGFDILHSNMPVPDLYVVKHKLYKHFVCVTTMHCFYETDLVQRKGLIKGLIEKNLWKYALNRLQNVIVSSTCMQKYYEHELSCKHDFEIIPYGIPHLDIEAEEASVLNEINSLKSKHKLICSCGTLIKRKGFHQLVNYLSHNASAAVVLFGRGILEGELREQAKKLGVQNRLLFLGYMNAPYRYYYLMDAFAMCSNSEGFGLALLEAMQVGTPIICTNLPIYNDYFTDKDVGLFEYDDQDSFNKAADKVVQNKEYYAAKSLFLSETFFSLKNMGIKHYEYYQNLLEGKKHG